MVFLAHWRQGVLIVTAAWRQSLVVFVPRNDELGALVELVDGDGFRAPN